tara:strand:+ start:2372 stop:3166 length:795 start_codon:yes stop_codon:yes gene_type:complete
MEPNKFEDTIREKLQEREIQPSSDSWKKLNARLGKPEKKKSYFIWYAVAASLVSILVIGSLLFNKTDEASNSEEIVETLINKEVLDSEKQTENVPQKTNIEEVAVQENSVLKEESEQQVPKKQLSKHTLQPKQPIKISEEKVNDKAIAKTETNFKEEFIPNDKVENKTDEYFIESKVNEVVAQVKEIQDKNNTVTAEEVDALLANAQRDIKTRQILNPETQKVDAAALLLDVELELERSFREKVFDALGEGFNKIRTAVTERNN